MSIDVEKKIQQSAGCFVWVNDEFLVLFREKDGTWGIPGGKVEEGETYERAAWRELFEETGIRKMPYHVFRDLGTYEVFLGYIEPCSLVKQENVE